MRKILMMLALVGGAAFAVAGCDDNSCETQDDCPVIECDDGSTVQACVFGTCADSCESGDGMMLTEPGPDGG
jgi:hypothetical protein